MSKLLCKLGWHRWPRWTLRKASLGPDFHVRRCRRCGLRQARSKETEAIEAGLRG